MRGEHRLASASLAATASISVGLLTAPIIRCSVGGVSATGPREVAGVAPAPGARRCDGRPCEWRRRCRSRMSASARCAAVAAPASAAAMAALAAAAAATAAASLDGALSGPPPPPAAPPTAAAAPAAELPPASMVEKAVAEHEAAAAAATPSHMGVGRLILYFSFIACSLASADRPAGSASNADGIAAVLAPAIDLEASAAARVERRPDSAADGAPTREERVRVGPGAASTFGAEFSSAAAEAVTSRLTADGPGASPAVGAARRLWPRRARVVMCAIGGFVSSIFLLDGFGSKTRSAHSFTLSTPHLERGSFSQHTHAGMPHTHTRREDQHSPARRPREAPRASPRAHLDLNTREPLSLFSATGYSRA